MFHSKSFAGSAIASYTASRIKRSDQYSLLHSSSTAAAYEADENKENAEESTLLLPTKKQTNISPAKGRFFLATFLFLSFMGAALFSLPAPFFPSRAMEKGMPQTVAGLVLGSMQLIQFVAAITFAFVMFYIGLKFMLCFGVFWVSICAVLFGILDLGPNDSSYIALCFIVRIIQGMGVSAYYISSSTMAAVLFNENYAFTAGLLSTSYSIGCLVGPSIGGALYAAGGYICPFAVMGCLLFSLAPIMAYTIPSDICENGASKKKDESNSQVAKKMASPALFALFYCYLVGTFSTVFSETTVGVRLAAFNVTDPLVVGLIYLSSSGAYGLAAPIAGRIADKYDKGWLVIFVGTWMAIFGCILMGPSPILVGMEPGLAQLICGLLIAHSGYSCCLIPMTRELQRLADANGLDKEAAATLSFISAFIDCCWGMGGFLGAFLSAALMEHLGYPLATSIQALILLPSILMQLLLMIKFGHLKCCRKNQEKRIAEQ